MDVVRMLARAAVLPRDLAAAAVSAPRNAVALADGVQDVAGQMLGLIPRVQEVMTRVELSVERIEAISLRAEGVVGASETVAAAAGTVTSGAALTVELAEAEIQRVRGLIGLYDEQLAALAPLLSEVALEVQPQHVRALTQALEAVPRVLALADPALTTLAQLAPGLEELGERLDDVGEVIQGIPGADLFRRRAQAADDSPASSQSTA